MDRAVRAAVAVIGLILATGAAGGDKPHGRRCRHAVHDVGMRHDWPLETRGNVRAEALEKVRDAGNSVHTIIQRTKAATGTGKFDVTIEQSAGPTWYHDGSASMPHWFGTGTESGHNYIISFELPETILLRFKSGEWNASVPSEPPCTGVLDCTPCSMPHGVARGGVVPRLRSPVFVGPQCVQPGIESARGSVVGAGPSVVFPTADCGGTEHGPLRYFIFEHDGPNLTPRCTGTASDADAGSVSVSMDPQHGASGRWLVASIRGVHATELSGSTLTGFSRAGELVP